MIQPESWSHGASQRCESGWRFGSKVRYAKTTATQIAARVHRKRSTIRRMAPRYFTVVEANRAVGALRPTVEEMVDHRRRFIAARDQREALTRQAGSNGGDLTPTDFVAVEEELELQAAALANCIERIQAAGALVKDLDVGLLDFPALRDGEEILLCWRLGEDEIAYFHGADEGFAERKPL
jgi:hypothetical protein